MSDSSMIFWLNIFGSLIVKTLDSFRLNLDFDELSLDLTIKFYFYFPLLKWLSNRLFLSIILSPYSYQ
jgi:hypothetical protein